MSTPESSMSSRDSCTRNEYLYALRVMKLLNVGSDSEMAVPSPVIAAVDQPACDGIWRFSPPAVRRVVEVSSIGPTSRACSITWL